MRLEVHLATYVSVALMSLRIISELGEGGRGEAQLDNFRICCQMKKAGRGQAFGLRLGLPKQVPSWPSNHLAPSLLGRKQAEGWSRPQ